MTYIVDYLERYKQKSVVGFFEDWTDNFVTGDRWTTLTADSSSASTLVITNKTAAGGILQITQDATDNDEIYFQTTVMPFLIAADKPMIFECRLNAPAITANNVVVGFQSGAATADDILDDGGGPKASATQALIYYVDGGTNWVCRSQIGAAVGRTTTTSAHAFAPVSSGAYTTLRIEVNPISSTVAEVIYSWDDSVSGMRQMKDSNGVPIKHQLVYTNAVACGAFIGCKTGAAEANVLKVDYVAAFQKR